MAASSAIICILAGLFSTDLGPSHLPNLRTWNDPGRTGVLSSQYGPSGSWKAGTAPSALSASVNPVQSFRDADGEPAGGFVFVRLHVEDDLAHCAAGELGGVLPGENGLSLVGLG